MGKKKGATDEDSNVNADDIPADSREMVQRLKEIVNLSEQEIYAMLVECDMDDNKAIDRLLSQEPFQEVKSKRGKKKETKDTSDSCSQGVDNSIQNRELNETSDAQGTCNQLADSSTTSSILGSYPYNSDLANGETKIVPVSSAEAVPSLSVPSSSDLPNVETKGVPISSGKAVPSLSVRRSRLIPAWDGGISGQRTMADVVKMALGLSKESVTETPIKDDCPLHEKPDVTDPSSNSFVESDARRDQLRESASVSNQNLPDDNVRKDQLREPALGLSKKSVTETPIKDDCPLHEKPDVTDPFSNSFVESDARRDQLRESASISNHNLRHDGVTNPLSNSFIEPAARRDQLGESALISNQNLPDDRLSYYLSKIKPAAWRDQLQESASIANQNLRNDDYGGSKMCDEDNNKNVETYQMQRCWFEHNQTKDPSASIVTSLQQLSVEKENDEPKALVKEFADYDSEDIQEFADDLSLKHYNTRDDEGEEPSRDLSEEQMAYQTQLNAYYRETEPVQYETHEPARENQHKSSSAADFTFDDCQRLNPALERSLQMQSSNTFPNVMHQGAYTREPDPQYSAFPFNQSMPTASSLRRRPSTSMNEALRSATIFVPQRNQQAMNHHYSHPQVPLAHYGNMTSSPYLPPKQNNSYNMPPPSIFQQHGGSNNNTYYHQPLASMLPEYRNSHLPQSAAAIVSSANGSAYAVGTSSDNAANSRFGYEDVLSSQINRSNRLPSIQHQNVNSNVWRVQGEDTWSLVPRHRSQQTQSFRQSQQQKQEQEQQLYRGLYYERSSSYYASLNQQNNTSDPSDQTKQWLWPRDNY